MKRLHVGINAQLPGGGVSGGIEQFLLGLVHGLGRLDGPEDYVLVGPREDPYWLEPYLGANERVVPPHLPENRRPPRVVRALRRAGRAVWPGKSGHRLPDNAFDALGVDVVHFPFQSYVPTRAPSIYNPHDLQHLHYPEFFSKEDYEKRERLYPEACRSAAAVVVESHWIKDDIVRHYGIDPDKIHVVLWGAPTEIYERPAREAVERMREELRLPEAFALYPAQTWAHKNHIRLAEALKILRDEDGVRLDVVCTGTKNAHWSRIEAELHRLGVSDQMHFLGFVAPGTLRALYASASFLIFPSLFEGGGFPILEGFHEGTPVACSAVTSLPEYAGDAALLFDASSVESIAAAVKRMATDESLRSTLRARGSARIREFSWERAAKGYRAIYRSVAGRHVSEEDAALLAENR